KLVAVGIQLEPEGRMIITVSEDFHHKHIIAHVGEGLHGFRLEVHQLFKFTIGIQVVRGNGSGISLSIQQAVKFIIIGDIVAIGAVLLNAVADGAYGTFGQAFGGKQIISHAISSLGSSGNNIAGINISICLSAVYRGGIITATGQK